MNGAGGMGGPGAGGMAGGYGGAGAGGMPPEYGEWDQGVESEKGTPMDSPFSRRLSRGADVARLGYLGLLGGTVANALSFDTSKIK
jgi:hypothetical protein